MNTLNKRKNPVKISKNYYKRLQDFVVFFNTKLRKGGFNLEENANIIHKEFYR